jgi:transposase-like protein
MVRGVSLRKTAEFVGIHHTTVFYWRQKILDALDVLLDDTTLVGTVQVDETFILESCKGNHKHNPEFEFPNGRKARKRGGKSKKRGQSKDQVCVTCGIDQRNHLVMKVSNYGHISGEIIEKVFDGKINNESILCSDGLKGYKTFAKNPQLEHIIIPAGKYKVGIYHINKVNSLHSRFKGWLERYNGVSTKYLQNYVTWFKWLEKYGDLKYTDKIKDFMIHSNCVFKETRYTEVTKRNFKILFQ